tara:strand:- start:23 stop:1996 length:1974 start_codon:yes stop_codon:yes gene_type:complete
MRPFPCFPVFPALLEPNNSTSPLTPISSARVSEHRRKYAFFFCMAMALGWYYSNNEVRFSGTFDPQGSLEAYKAKLAEIPSLTCECKNQGVPMGEYTTTNLNMTTSCDWFRKDMEIFESDPMESTCKYYELVGYCSTVDKACNQSETILNWVKKELHDNIIFSTQLMAEASLSSTLDKKFDGLYQIASVMSTSSLDVVESWAGANMPKLHKMLGGLIGRVRALTKKQLHDLHDDTNSGDIVDVSAGSAYVTPSAKWTAFKTACESTEPIWCEALWDSDPVAFLKGDRTVCPLANTVYRCDAEQVGDGKCDWLCMSEACLFDGGDCGGKDLSADLYGRYQMDSAFATSDAYLRDGKLAGDLHWLDTPDDYYLNSTKRRCDAPLFWNLIGWFPEDDETDYTVFHGGEWSQFHTHWFTNNGRTPPSSRFTASYALGCDGFKKNLKNNFFDYYDPDEFKTWHSEWETGLKKIREEVSLSASDQSSLDTTLNNFKKVGDFMIKGTIPMMEYFDDLETAMKELFVIWNASSVTLDYEKYFNACAPTTCSYVYQDTPSSAAIASIVFGLIGGISAAMDSIFMVIYKVCKKIILGPSVDDESPASKGDTKTRKVKPEAAKGKADKKTEKKAEKKKEDAVLHDADEEEDEEDEDEEEEDVEVLVQK